jgi:hypothetical protein
MALHDHPIEPMMLPRELSIVISHVFQIAILANLPKFSDSWNEDLALYVEKFKELLISSLVI